MASALRIIPPSVVDDGTPHTPSTPAPVKEYVDRLVKLVPAEVVSLYLAGKAGIQARFPSGGTTAAGMISQNAFWIGWTLFCLFAVIVLRAWVTSDSARNVKPEWKAVWIAAASFIVWVYSMGDVFALHGIWEPLLAMLLVLAWTFAAPIFYRP